jgi:hypothetical protein
MSQTILPPSPQPDPQSPAQLPAQPPTYYYPANDTSAVIVSEPPTQGFQPDPPKKQPLIWRIIKWPIRQIFKLIYVILRGARAHKVIAAILLILILGLVGAGVVGYRYLNPPSTASTAGQAGASANVPDTPFTIVDSSAPPLSTGVIHWLHAYKTYNGQEQWDSLSPSYQQAISSQGQNAAGMQSAMDQIHAQGITFLQFIYSGGYVAPTGLATYTVQVIVQEAGQRAILTWYFYVDASTDLILQVVNLTPGANG